MTSIYSKLFELIDIRFLKKNKSGKQDIKIHYWEINCSEYDLIEQCYINEHEGHKSSVT